VSAPWALLLVLALVACNQDMSDQKKLDHYKASGLFPNGRVIQALPPGTVARDDLARDAALAAPPPLTMALLQHGRERYGIFCAPCHGESGNGDGIIVQRGFPHPPSFDDQPLRTADDRHFVDIITRGYGDMSSYAARVPPDDRWAITAYIRALQLAARTRLADLPAEARARLGEPP